MTKEWFDKVGYFALADTETTEATYDIACDLIRREIVGDFVECGVFSGAQTAMMARAIMDSPPERNERRVHLFDSFSGIPIAGPEDQELQGKPAGISSCSLREVQKNMRSWGIPDRLLVYHEGLFEDTVPYASDRRDDDPEQGELYISDIAFLRLDGDLYRSTTECLQHLYPKLSRGAWVCIDDFNLSGCRKAILEHVIPAPVYWRIPTK